MGKPVEAGWAGRAAVAGAQQRLQNGLFSGTAHPHPPN